MRLLIALLMSTVAFAQYQAVPSSGYPTLDGILNGKPAATVGSGVPGGLCTAGKDFYTNLVNGDLYLCTATNTWTLKSLSVVTSAGTCGDATHIGQTTRDVQGRTISCTNIPILNPAVADGTWCISVSGGVVVGLVACSSGPSALSWAGLSNVQWTGMSNAQWTSITN